MEIAWRDELYDIYHPDGSSALALFPPSSVNHTGGMMTNKAFKLERAACSIFGVATFGVHLRAYEFRTNGEGKETMMVWVPRRARTKETYPGKLDSVSRTGRVFSLETL